MVAREFVGCFRRYLQCTQPKKGVLFVLIVSAGCLTFFYENIIKWDFGHVFVLQQHIGECLWNVTINNQTFTLSLSDMKARSIHSILSRVSAHSSKNFSLHFQTFCVKRNESTTTTTSTASTTTTTKSTRNEPGLLCFHPSGRLGNQLFTYASAYGIARHTGKKLVIDQKSSLVKLFKLNATFVNKSVCDQSKRWMSKLHCGFDGNLFKIPRRGNFIVGHYLQSWKYFENVNKEIRHQFTFNKPIINKSLAILKNVSEEYKKRTVNSTNKQTLQNISFVGVHIRRGDLTSKSGSKFGYTTAPKEYIENAMNYFLNISTNVIFMIFSNGMEWAKNNVKQRTNVFFIGGNSPEVDLCTLAHCNSTIMTVGTFGWFGGYLARGVTVYYKHPCRENSSLRKQFSADFKDYFFPGWIGME